MATSDAIAKIVEPSSVVVIGANEQVGKLTSGSVSNLLRHGYPGRLHIVNPNRDSVFGVPTVKSIQDLPEVPDTAVIAVSAGRVPNALAECADAGIRTATVVASGFGEGPDDEAGRQAQAALQEVLQATGIRILGPNTAGLLNVSANYVPRASENHPILLPDGPIGLVTQSGGLCNTVINRAAANGIGIGLAVSTGNQVDIDLWDVAEYMLDDDRLSTVITIVEGFKDAPKFLAFANRARQVNKPVIALKLGTSEAGQRAVETHSGSMAGSAAVQSAVLADLGVIQVDELDQLWEVASLFSSWGVPSGRVRSLGIVTPSGGDGVMATDKASSLGLDVPHLSEETTAQMLAIAPRVKPENPFDTQAALVVSAPDSLPKQIELVARDEGMDAVLLALPVLATPFALTALPAHLEGIAAAGPRRVASSLWAAGGATQEAIDQIRAQGWPVFASSVRAVAAIAHYARYAETLERQPGTWVGGSVDDKGELLSYWRSREVLEKAGVPFNTAVLVQNIDDARAAADQIGGPVTLKLSTLKFNHKADAGALIPYVTDATSVATGSERLLNMLPEPSDGQGLVVEEFVPSVFPVFLGAHRDPEFGPVLMVGLGGGFAEAYGDVARISCPSSIDQIRTALRTTTLSKLLAKYPRAEETLLQIAERLAERMGATDWLSFDVNPLLVKGDSTVVAVDARLSLDRSHQPGDANAAC